MLQSPPVENWLDALLEEEKMSPADLSRLASLDQGLISKLRRGKTVPTRETLRAIAKATRRSVEEIYRRAGELPQVDKRTEYLRRIENKLARLPDDAIRERVERIIDLFVPDDKNDGKEKQ